MFQKETGLKGTRVCKFAKANTDTIMVNKYKIEYPRHLVKIRMKDEKRFGRTVRQLRFMRKVFTFALEQLDHERTLCERVAVERQKLRMQLEDPKEQVRLSQCYFHRTHGLHLSL